MDFDMLRKLSALEDYLRMRAIPNRPASYFKYLSAEVAKIVLVNQRLRWSSPLRFNDPFDVQRCFDLGFDTEELKKPLCQELINLLTTDQIPDLSHNCLAEWLITHLRRDDRARERDIIISELPNLIAGGIKQARRNGLESIKKQWGEFLPEFRILCLSAIHDNMLMWSHYSNSHKGVVLEFQPRDDDSYLWAALPVQYQDVPPTIATKEKWIKSITGQELLNAYDWRFYMPLTVTKTMDWKYEKEWRVVSFMRNGESGLYSDYSFDPRELRSVYLGCETKQEDADDMIALLKYDLAHVVVWRGRKSERERSLHFDRVDPQS